MVLVGRLTRPQVLTLAALAVGQSSVASVRLQPWSNPRRGRIRQNPNPVTRWKSQGARGCICSCFLCTTYVLARQLINTLQFLGTWPLPKMFVESSSSLQKEKSGEVCCLGDSSHHLASSEITRAILRWLGSIFCVPSTSLFAPCACTSVHKIRE